MYFNNYNTKKNKKQCLTVFKLKVVFKTYFIFLSLLSDNYWDTKTRIKNTCGHSTHSHTTVFSICGDYKEIRTRNQEPKCTDENQSYATKKHIYLKLLKILCDYG